MAGLDLMGQVFGRLTVIAKGTRKSGGYNTWKCRCECGRVRTVRSGSLRTGNTKSCGCVRLETRRAKGHLWPSRYTAEQRELLPTWKLMRQRCHNPDFPGFAGYGARGIVMCDAWRDSLEAFCADMGPRPSEKHSVDRIDNDKGYEPGNCRWATNFEQSSNRRYCHRVVVNGEVVPLAIVARREGIEPSRARYLLKRGRYYPEAPKHPA